MAGIVADRDHDAQGPEAAHNLWS